MGRGVLALFGAVLCWSSVPLFLRYFTVEYDAWTVNGVRYGLAALLLLPLAVRGARRTTAAGRSIWVAALVPFAVNVVGQIGWALTPYYVNASVMAFGLRSAFFFTVLGGFLFLPDERGLLKSPLFWVGAVLCVAGVSLMMREGLRESPSAGIGMLLVLGTAAIWGFYYVTVRRFMKELPPLESFAVVCLYTAVVLVGIMFLRGDWRALGRADGQSVGLLFVSAVVGIAAAHLLAYVAIRRVGAMVAAGAEFLLPFFTFAGAVVLFHERLSGLQWVGGVTVVAGSVLLLVGKWKLVKQTP